MSRISSSRRDAFALVAFGGFAGAVTRYGVALALPATFPVGTLTANTLGTILLGFIVFDERLANSLSSRARLLAGTGFCSSFTTYSNFAAETMNLAPRLAVLNIVATYGLGLAGVLIGRAIARWVA